MPIVHQVAVGFHRDQMVGKHTECVDGLLSAHRNADADRDVGQVPQPRGVHLVVVAPPVHQITAEQAANDFDGLAQHVLALSYRRPTPADHVLVEVFTAAQTQRESPVGEDLHRRRLLGDDRRVVAHGRTRHVGVEVDAVGGLRYRTEHRPRIGRMTLRREPR